MTTDGLVASASSRCRGADFQSARLGWKPRPLHGLEGHATSEGQEGGMRDTSPEVVKLQAEIWRRIPLRERIDRATEQMLDYIDEARRKLGEKGKDPLEVVRYLYRDEFTDEQWARIEAAFNERRAKGLKPYDQPQGP
jgi:hypothetical protein